ncbi:MAG TPA: carboxypeptidase-like regulatory domain-containing protein, partial [Candidatus Hydrogenedentes bacterium]|nr:carboxypeptidase-like regulatory domain-containing protein [Candidatus Hydrogenedentota bacterium]
MKNGRLAYLVLAGILILALLCVLLGWFYLSSTSSGQKRDAPLPVAERDSPSAAPATVAQPSTPTPRPTVPQVFHAHLSVFVHDNAGLPVPGATVQLKYIETPDTEPNDMVPHAETTAQDGVATFSGIPWGYVWLYAERGNLRSSTTSTRLHARDNFQEVILKLESTAVIRGIVVNESGEPVAGADVVVSEKDLTRTSARTDSPDAEVTGEDGSFAFDTLPEGVYKFTAFADMYAPGE